MHMMVSFYSKELASDSWASTFNECRSNYLVTVLCCLSSASFINLPSVPGLAHGCGKPTHEPSVSRVVNGEDAQPYSWPWQVSQYEAGSGSRACANSSIHRNIL